MGKRKAADQPTLQTPIIAGSEPDKIASITDAPLLDAIARLDMPAPVVSAEPIAASPTEAATPTDVPTIDTPPIAPVVELETPAPVLAPISESIAASTTTADAPLKRETASVASCARDWLVPPARVCSCPGIRSPCSCNPDARRART